MDEIISMRRWLLWTEARRNDETTKQPIAPWITGNYYTPINAHDPNNWTTYDIANQYLKEHGNENIGLAIDLGDGIVGIDLDKCIDENGRFTKEAEDIVSMTDSYVEISPSGKGLHILGFGAIPKALIHRKGNFNLEIYSDGRFFTFTGRAMKGRTELRNMQDLLDELYAEYDSAVVDIERIKKGVKKGERDDAGIKLATWYRRKGLSDSETLEKMIEWNAKNDPPLPINEVFGKVSSAFRRPEPYGWRYTIQPEVESEDKTKAEKIANQIMQKYRFKTATDTKTIYAYHDGIYRDDGEVIIEQEVENSGEKVTNHLVNEVIGHIQRLTYIDRDEFNKTNALPVANGIIDLDDDFTLHEFDPEKIFTYKLDIEYDPYADCPKIKKFINDVAQKEDIDTIQEFLGYCLYPGLPAHKSLWLYGTGANGKTQFTELIQMLVGEGNTADVELDQLDGGHRFEVARLYGKMVNIVSEPMSHKELRTPLFKKLTGGDSVEGELKNKQNKIRFKNFAKFVIDGNKFPKVDDDTYAFWRRILAIKFINKFEGENNIKNIARQLWSDARERSGFLNWCLDGLRRLKNNNWEFSESKSMEETKLEFQKQSDPVMAFITDMCEIKEGAEISKEELYNKFKDYCDENGLFIVEQRLFTRHLQETPRVRMKKKSTAGGKWFWIGIGLKDEENKNEPKGWF